MPEDEARGTDRGGRRSKRMLSASEKYEVWLQLVRGEVTMAEAAANWQVDRSTIMRIRTVAKEGALAALAASKPGVRSRERDHELEVLQAENARLAEAVKQLAVKLTLIEGKDGWG
jgi:transposase